MKGWQTLAIGLFLVGCQNGGSGGSSGAPGDSKPRPPKEELKWGDLSCQKARSCKDPVLNKSWSDLNYFFQLNLQKPQARSANDSHEMLVYRCGLKTQRSWTEFFRVAPGSNEETAIAESDFFDGILNFDSCSYGEDLEGKLTVYFKNTEEFKNESK